MECSLFKDFCSPAAYSFPLDRVKFAKIFSNRDIRPGKVGKMFAPASFSGSRSKVNFISAQGICLDFDKGQPSIIDVLGLFPEAHLAYYSTHSNTSTQTRFRVVLPLSRSVNADEHASLVQGVKHIITPALHLCLDETCFQKERAHYLPSCPAEYEIDAFLGCQDGVPLDVESLMILGDITAAIRTEQTPATPVFTQDLAPVSSSATHYEFTDPTTGEIFDLTAWVTENPNFNIVAAVDPRYHVGKAIDGKQHIKCPFEDQHSEHAGDDKATFIANASPPQYTAWTVHCCHAHCIGRDRLDFLQAILEKGWMAIGPHQIVALEISELRRPPKIYFPVNEILASPQWSSLKPDELGIALQMMMHAWSTDEGIMNDDNWMMARHLGISEEEWMSYRETLIRTGWLIVSDGTLTNSIVKQQFDNAKTAYNGAIAKASKGGRKTQEKAKIKLLLQAPA